MEERTGAQLNRVPAPALDPAQIPGLIAPVVGAVAAPGVPAQSSADTAEDASAVRKPSADTAEEQPESSGEPPEQAAAAEEKADEAAEAAGAAEDADAGPADGPDFQAGDHRGGVEIDPLGVRFRLDEESAEFTWAEIGAIEYSTGRFPTRLTVTVHTTERQSYPVDVQTGSRSTIKDWTTRLDEVLDAYLPE